MRLGRWSVQNTIRACAFERPEPGPYCSLVAVFLSNPHLMVSTDSINLCEYGGTRHSIKCLVDKR